MEYLKCITPPPLQAVSICFWPVWSWPRHCDESNYPASKIYLEIWLTAKRQILYKIILCFLTNLIFIICPLKVTYWLHIGVFSTLPLWSQTHVSTMGHPSLQITSFLTRDRTSLASWLIVLFSIYPNFLNLVR